MIVLFVKINLFCITASENDVSHRYLTQLSFLNQYNNRNIFKFNFQFLGAEKSY
jgi:hypothetical protein